MDEKQTDMQDAPIEHSMLGVRAVDFVFKNFLLLTTLGLIGAAAGWSISLLGDHAFATSATIEIGGRTPQEPIEPPLASRERLIGLAGRHVKRVDEDATVVVSNRRDATTHTLTRHIDVSVRAKTASAARSILDGTMRDFLAEHAHMHDFEHRLLDRELSLYQGAAARLRNHIAEDTNSSQALSAALLDTYRMTNTVAAAMSALRTPPTRVVSKHAEPERARSRAPVLSLAGFLLGLLAAGSWAALRGFGIGIVLLAALSLMTAACSNARISNAEESCRALEQAGWRIDEIPPAPSSCPDPPAPRDLSGQRKIAVSVYHFNVQYVAGGLRGFPDGEIVERYDLDEAAVEDRIIRQGLEPVLDLFLAHPTFHADIELQAYTVEIVARRHPDVLKKMRALAERGQVDFDSFHYSDQLYVAYPRRDLEVSLDLVDEVFSRVCLPRGRVVFTQEGQFARGQLAIAEARGYRASVLPKNLFTYQMGDEAARKGVLFEDPSAPDHPIILGGQTWSGDGFDLLWTFMDDGEIAFSEGRLNPYFGLDYKVSPEAISDHAAALEELEKSGFVHATIAEAVAAMKGAGITPARLPPILDGTWQPKDTNNLFRWMGGAGLFRAFESDSHTLASIWRASRSVRYAETIAVRSIGLASGRLVPGAVSSALTTAWREVLFAEVSDSTGWNPFRNEVEYSRTHSSEAERLAGRILACLGEHAPPGNDLRCETETSRALADLGVEVIAPARAVRTNVRACATPPGSDEQIHAVTIEVPKLVDTETLFDESDQASLERDLEIRFALANDRDLFLVEALDPSPRKIDLEEYAFDSIGVALPMGLIGLGERRFVIQDMTAGRVAAVLTRRGSAKSSIRFLDQTVSRASASTRRFLVLEDVDTARALALAHRINGPFPSGP